MKELSPRAKAMLQIARETTGSPQAGARDRLERRLEVRVAAGAALAAAGASATKVASAAGLSVIKTLAVIGVGAAASVVGYQVLESAPPAPVGAHAPVAAAANQRVSSPETGPVAGEPVAAELAQMQAPPPKADGSPVAPPRAELPRSTAPHGLAMAGTTENRGLAPAFAPSSDQLPRVAGATSDPRQAVASVGDFDALHGAAPAAPISPLQAETQSLRRIQGALRAGDGSRALDLLATAAVEFPSGALHQERAAARVQALCLSGQIASAQAAARAFVERWPGSPLRARVETSCR